VDTSFGFLVSASLDHALVETMQGFTERTRPHAKLGILATSILVVAPIRSSPSREVSPPFCDVARYDLFHTNLFYI
jgi:hypothetical protein